MSDKEHEIATVEINGDVFVATQTGSTINIYDADGNNMITFYHCSEKQINEFTLQLIVSAYRRGYQRGIDVGKALWLRSGGYFVR